jgi:hypothetical protein
MKPSWRVLAAVRTIGGVWSSAQVRGPEKIKGPAGIKFYANHTR